MFLAHREKYKYQVQEALGADYNVGYFEDSDLTPELDYYDDNVNDGFEGTPDEILLPTLEVNDNYAGENILLPCGNDMA